MNEYKSNSHRSKEDVSGEVVPVKKVERVANGKTRRKNEVRKLADVFIAEDVHSVKDYMYHIRNTTNANEIMIEELERVLEGMIMMILS